MRLRMERAVRRSAGVGGSQRSIIAYLPLMTVSSAGSAGAISLLRALLTSPIFLRSSGQWLSPKV